jgi:hypothetical protein
MESQHPHLAAAVRPAPSALKIENSAAFAWGFLKPPNMGSFAANSPFSSLRGWVVDPWATPVKITGEVSEAAAAGQNSTKKEPGFFASL